MEAPIVNKVAESGLITLNLEAFLPAGPVKIFDIKDFLFMGLILKEKDFRTALQSLDWSVYKESHVAVTCSADAIIPSWAYMLIATYLQPVAASVYLGTAAEMEKFLVLKEIEALDAAAYTDKRLVIKGCADVPVPDAAYLAITQKLLPVAKSILYGEPCSTVPVYKKR
jgi:hypothetical protein